MVYKLTTFIAVSSGLLSFAAPYQAATGIALLLASTTAFLCAGGRHQFASRICVAAAILALVFTLNLDAVLATSFLAATVIGLQRKNFLLPAVILLLQSSVTASFDALLAEKLDHLHVASASSSLICFMALAIVLPNRTFITQLFAASIASIILSITSYFIAKSPLTAMVLTCAPLVFISYIVARKQYDLGRNRIGVVSLVAFVSLLTFSWLANHVHSSSSRYLLLQDVADEPEGKFYRAYENVLAYAGLGFKVTDNPNDIEDGSLVLLPWLTKEFDNETHFIEQYRRTAKNKKLLTVLVGEHDNMNGVANRINRVVGKTVLEDNLTVPHNNTDESGALRVSSIEGWNPRSIFNRGASVKISSLFDKVLLSGDAWWIEPNINEWLWVGDYKWSPFDRYGRITLGGAFSTDEANWVVLGDSGPFLNLQILADPLLTEHILEISSLYPLLIKDGLLLFLIAIYALYTRTGREKSAYTLLTGAIICAPIAFAHASDLTTRWIRINGLDERSSNELLIKSAGLLDSGWRFYAPNNQITSHTVLPDGNIVVFSLVESNYRFSTAYFSDCLRIGNIQSEEGPFLLDAQSCKVSGTSNILIGDNSGAAAVAVEDQGRTVIFILDKRFLAKNAPTKNADWLQKVLQTR